MEELCVPQTDVHLYLKTPVKENEQNRKRIRFTKPIEGFASNGGTKQCPPLFKKNHNTASSPRSGFEESWSFRHYLRSSPPGEHPLFNKFHVVGRKHPKVTIGPVTSPPALVNHLNVCDNVLRVERDLCVVS